MTTVTFEEKGGTTLVVLHELYPSKEALDEAIASGSTGGWTEQVAAQLDVLIRPTLVRARDVGHVVNIRGRPPGSLRRGREPRRGRRLDDKTEALIRELEAQHPRHPILRCNVMVDGVLTTVRRCIDEGLVGGEGLRRRRQPDPGRRQRPALRAYGSCEAGRPDAVAPANVGKCREYLDEAAPRSRQPRRGRSSSHRLDPAARWITVRRGPAFFAYAANYLIDLRPRRSSSATTASRQAAPLAAKPHGRALGTHRVGSLSGPLIGRSPRYGTRPRCLALAGRTSAGSSRTFPSSTSPRLRTRRHLLAPVGLQATTMPGAVKHLPGRARR